MARIARHLSLSRIHETELRVISDVEAGILPVIQAEEEVIRQYQATSSWPHRWVTLFILQDMQPLIRQLGAKEEAAGAASNLPPGGVKALELRTVVNAYDLEDLDNCHVFINQRAMCLAGYWEDALSLRALLAHEHAHPLAENDTVRASRRLCLETCTAATAKGELAYAAQVMQQATLLAQELALYGPREVAANELALRCGFAAPLFHLERSNAVAAQQALAGREELTLRLQDEQHAGHMTVAEANVLLLLADLQRYADWAFEIAAFHRTGEEHLAQDLEAALQRDIFPHLMPQVSSLYATFGAQYCALRPDCTVNELLSWGQGLLQPLSHAIATQGIQINLELRAQEG